MATYVLEGLVVLAMHSLTAWHGDRSADSRPGVELRASWVGGTPVVAAEVNGIPARLLLDTGATRSRVSAAFARRARLAATARYRLTSSAGSPVDAVCAAAVPVRLASTTTTIPCLGWIPAAAEPAANGTPARSGSVDGLLGADALRDVDLLMDARSGRVKLAPAGTLSHTLESGRVLPLHLIEGRPSVALHLEAPDRDAPPVQMVIDSGADRPILFGAAARRLAPGAQRRGASVETATGRVHAALSPRQRATLGEHRLELPPMVLLEHVNDRSEDGLLPLADLPPILLQIALGRIVLGPYQRRSER